MQLLTVFCLVCVCCWSAANASLLNATSGITPYASAVEEAPQCRNAWMAAHLRCSELELMVRDTVSPAQRAEVILRSTWWLCVGLIVVTLAAVCWAVKCSKQHRDSHNEWLAEKEQLLMKWEGAKAQAFDFATKLHSPAPADPTGKGAHVVQGLQLHDPIHQAVVLPSPGGQPPSAASTPPGPQSESSAPNLALLVAEASPAKDAAGSTGDQHTSLSPSQDAGAVKLLGGKPLNPVSPGQTTVLMPQHVSAGKLQGQMGSPDARYSPKRSPGAASTAPRLLPGGPVAMSVRASSPSASPNSGYLGPQPATSGVQRPANAAPGCWTPQMQPGQHQQAVSCPPIPGPGAATPTSSAPAAAGLMPQSAGQLGGAAPGSAAVQRRVEELSQETSTLKTTVTELQQQLSWVNTSRGSGTPMPFNGMSPQQLFASPGLPGAGSPLASGLCTPATGSTTRSAGSLTHVQSVNSIAGSCGGSVPGFTGTPGSTTPMSVGSTASGAGGPSAGSGSPARPPITELLGRLDDLANASKMKKQRALRDLEAARKKAEQQSPAASSRAAGAGPTIRHSPV